ncbi:bomanin-23-like [Drosophila innubila]|uniref:bomanin-23-like n=1 Tax=Drosophila innubila TaxID=198719 RepID=UPI00148DD7E6|nr:bomanin-23-like [Drosophila innubila]
MRCITLLTVLVLAMLAVYVNAGKVVINGACVDCNTRKPVEDSTTLKPSSSHSHDHPYSNKDKDDSSKDSEQQIDAHVGRYRRQLGNRQVIYTNDGSGNGGWSGGRVTTIDGNRYPGTVVRNDDCVGCNIRG